MLKYDGTQFVNDHDPEAGELEAVLLAIDECAAILRDKFCAPTSPYEAASWSLKLAEAQAGGGELLAAEASVRGITMAALVAKVLANAASLAGLEATIAGTAGRHRDAARLLATREELLAYDWRAGWPE